MFVNIFKSKIHRATVTEACLNYMGSITIDSELMKAAKIRPNERVQIVDNNNGSRLETYVISGEPGSGIICLNGAAARLVQPGDTVIIISYAWMEEKEADEYQPVVVMVGEGNRIAEIRHVEHPKEIG